MNLKKHNKTGIHEFTLIEKIINKWVKGGGLMSITVLRTDEYRRKVRDGK